MDNTKGGKTKNQKKKKKKKQKNKRVCDTRIFQEPPVLVSSYKHA